MKDILRHIGISMISLYAVSLLYEGLEVSGGFVSYMVGGALLTLGFKIIKPLFQIITFPIQMVTFGLFSIAIITAILYIITSTYSRISVSPFTFGGFTIYTFSIPSFYASGILSFILVSATIYILIKILEKVYID